MLSDYWRQKCSFSTLTFSTFLPPPLLHLSSRGCPFEKEKVLRLLQSAVRDVEERSSLTRFPKYSQVFPNIRKYISIFPTFSSTGSSFTDGALSGTTGQGKDCKDGLGGKLIKIICSDFGSITLLVVPLPKTIILPPACDYSSHLGLRNKTTWGVHRSTGPPQVIVV